MFYGLNQVIPLPLGFYDNDRLINLLEYNYDTD